jgi:hypothetical protein
MGPNSRKTVPIEVESRLPAFFNKPVTVAGGVLISALALAWCIHALQAGRDPERGVLMTAALFTSILAAVPAAYFLRVRRQARMATAGLTVLTTFAVLLLAIYFFSVRDYVFFPADFLIWSEGNFVNDTLKFSVGYPLYSNQANNDSFHYTPGASLLTYLLTWLAGQGRSIAAMRVVQLIYTAAAAFVATLCCRRIVRMVWPGSFPGSSQLWAGFWYAVLFLIAANPLTNSFAHNLNSDALAQLVAITGYYLMLRYTETRSRGLLVLMAILVPAGFMVKQNLLLWGGLFAGFLLTDRLRRALLFALTATVLVGATLAACYWIWGTPFFYWNFYVLSKHPVSPLRSVQHALVAWPYFAAGLLGGTALLYRKSSKALLGAWLVWLVVIASGTYTSGVAWMMNHMGPGSLIAGVWFMAGLASTWNRAVEEPGPSRAEGWIRCAALTATVALFFGGMGLIRIPVRAVPGDAYRYVRDIEREFQGQQANRVLLDLGTWVYLKDGVVMGDRAETIGERGYSGTADFSGILSRIASHRYSKILMRGFHAEDFVYDYYLWPKPSGIRQALLTHYHETGRIRAVQANAEARNWAEDPYYVGEITILEPNPTQ